MYVCMGPFPDSKDRDCSGLVCPFQTRGLHSGVDSKDRDCSGLVCPFL